MEERIGIRVPKPFKEKLYEEAEKEDCSVSEYIRNILSVRIYGDGQ